MDISVIQQQVFTVDDFVRRGCCRDGVIAYRDRHFTLQTAVSRSDLMECQTQPSEMLSAMLINGYGDGYGYGDGAGNGYGYGLQWLVAS